jgi:hypothetical protein
MVWYRSLVMRDVRKRAANFLEREERLKRRAELGLPPSIVTPEQAEKIAIEYVIERGLRRKQLVEHVRSAKLEGIEIFEVKEMDTYWSICTHHNGAGDLMVKVDNQTGEVRGCVNGHAHYMR